MSGISLFKKNPPSFSTTKRNKVGCFVIIMENYIPISAINDFMFCPKSLYLHSVYYSFTTQIYHDTPQTIGKIKHENIDQGTYSTAKQFMQGLTVYSDRLRILGKIDVFDKENNYLIERKYRVKKIFDGYKYQLYAQMYCLEEIGLTVKKMFVHSLADNKRFEIVYPSCEEKKRFESLVASIHQFIISEDHLNINQNKCAHCIYYQLCDSSTYVNPA